MTASTGQIDHAVDALREAAATAGERPRLRPSLAAWMLVFAIAAVVYWPWLGGPGFSMTEGHRAIPGFEMVERWRAGDRDAWWSPTLFGQVYVRKPPGVPWLIALSSMVFGETEFAARVPSATAASLMALAALWFGTRWFGRTGGLACGLAQALWPWMWSSGRTAEIEAVHNAFVFLSVLIVVECVAFRTRAVHRLHDRVRDMPWAMALGLAIAGAGLAKGPAGWPAILGAIIAGAIVCGWRTTTRAWLAIALLVPAIEWGYVYLRMSHAVAATGQTPVTQGPSEFLWHAGKLSLGGIAKVLSMPLVALVSSLPASLALLFPWGGDAKREAGATPEYQAARILAFACIGSLLALAALGVDNPRYAMPNVCAVPMVVGYVVWGLGGTFTPLRRRIAEHLLLMRIGWGISTWVCTLLAGAVLWSASKSGQFRDDQTGPVPDSVHAGRTLANDASEAGARGATLLADHMVEAKPEVLWYMSHGARAAISPRWVPGLASGERPREIAAGALVLLRDDDGSQEWQAAIKHWGSAEDGGLAEISNGRVSKFRFRLFHWRPKRPGPSLHSEVSGAETSPPSSPPNPANDAPR